MIFKKDWHHERIDPVDLYKRSTGAIWSFSQSDWSFDHKKRVIRLKNQWSNVQPWVYSALAGMTSFIFKKSWNWRQNIKKYIFFDQVKKKFAHFWGLKSWSTNFNFEFLFCYCSLKWKEVICKIKNYSIYIIEIFHLVTLQYSICKLYCPLNIYSSTFLTNHEQFFKILVFFL